MNSPWKWKLFFFWHSVIALLLLSLFSPFSFWPPLDTACFRFLNAPLAHHPTARLFWAAANHSLADWLEDLCFLALSCAAILKTPRGKRRTKTAQLLFAALLTAATILCVNRLLCRDLLSLRRASPTAILPHPVLLSDYFPSLLVKVESSKSFPADHATTALLFACSYAYFVRGKLAVCALLYALLLSLPRLIVGAHWLSDIVVGSGSIVLFALTWALATPLAARSIHALEKFLALLAPKRRSTNSL